MVALIRPTADNGFSRSRQPLQHVFFTGAARAADDVNEILLERDRSLPISFDTFHANAFTQFVQRSGGKQLALRDDRDVRAKTLDDLQYVRREKDCQATHRETRQEILQRARSDRVDTL